MPSAVNPTLLIIRDGWGENHNQAESFCNAILRAEANFSRFLSKNWPRTEIAASGLAVGLPEGVMGNSEVGHQNIGAGRVVDQEVVRIDKAIVNGDLEKNPTLRAMFENAKNNDSKLHLIGLCSDGGVHSVLRHLYALLQFAKNAGLLKVFIHFISDGRDTAKDSGIRYLQEVESKCREIGAGRIATVMGRFWAMDRDNRWERVREAYDCLTGKNTFLQFKSAAEALQFFYKNPENENQTGDEFVAPAQIVESLGKFDGEISDNDSVLFFNFRGDRPREITRAFIQPNFDKFSREKLLKLHYVTLTDYEPGLCSRVIFHRPGKMNNILGEYVSKLGLTQFRCAETEKYAHVTFFFNDYREEPFDGEDRMLIPSPRDVSTYDQCPEMSAFAVKDAAMSAILSKKYSLIIVNFANPDMVGHTGNMVAAKKAVDVVDTCVRELLSAVDSVDGSALITADHGNVEKMIEPSSGILYTQHTTNDVEVVIYGKKWKNVQLQPFGALCDLAPTLLEMMNLPKPKEMTGNSLILNKKS